MITTKFYVFAVIKKVVKQKQLLQIHIQQKSSTNLTKITNDDNKNLYVYNNKKCLSNNLFSCRFIYNKSRKLSQQNSQSITTKIYVYAAFKKHLNVIDFMKHTNL